MLPSTTSFHHLPAGRPSSTFTVCDGLSGWQTIPGQWPWQTAACALLPAHSSIISSSQLVPQSFYSCCPPHPPPFTLYSPLYLTNHMNTIAVSNACCCASEEMRLGSGSLSSRLSGHWEIMMACLTPSHLGHMNYYIYTGISRSDPQPRHGKSANI